MSRLDDIFAARRAAGETSLMPFVTAGFPSLAATAQVVPALAEAGASAIEIGIPFSDPIADGRVIAASMYEALAGGVTPADVFATVRRVRPAVDLGLIAMVSHSIVERRGPARFLDDAADAGFDGMIVPDVDLGDAERLRTLADARDLSFALLVAPTTGPERLARVVALCSGFVYLLARVGLTGEREAPPEIAGRVAQIRRLTGLPVAVGFGVSSREHVRAVTETADAAIVGSALVRRMGDAPDEAAAVRAARAFVGDLAAGLARRSGRP